MRVNPGYSEVETEIYNPCAKGSRLGVPCEFLAYEKPGWSYDDALAITLLHDVMVRPAGFVSIPRLAPVWKTLDDFGLEDATFLPYWENGIKVSPESVKVSAYRKTDGRTLYVVSNLSPDQSVTAEVKLPTGVKKLELKPFRMELIEF